MSTGKDMSHDRDCGTPVGGTGDGEDVVVSTADAQTKEHKSPQWPIWAILGLFSGMTGTIRHTTVKMGPQKANWLTRFMFLRPFSSASPVT